jgi:hypothetical protein
MPPCLYLVVPLDNAVIAVSDVFPAHDARGLSDRPSQLRDYFCPGGLRGEGAQREAGDGGGGGGVRPQQQVL